MDGHHTPTTTRMVADCTTCPVRGPGCCDCFVAVMLDPSTGFDAPTRRAVAVLQDAGLIAAPHLALLDVLPAAADAADRPGSAGRTRRAG